MKFLRYTLKERFSLFDVAVAGFVVAAALNHDWIAAAVIFVAGAWLSGFLTAASKPANARVKPRRERCGDVCERSECTQATQRNGVGLNDLLGR